MLRVAGACLILSASSLLGVQKSRQFTKRIELNVPVQVAVIIIRIAIAIVAIFFIIIDLDILFSSYLNWV